MGHYTELLWIFLRKADTLKEQRDRFVIITLFMSCWNYEDYEKILKLHQYYSKDLCKV